MESDKDTGSNDGDEYPSTPKKMVNGGSAPAFPSSPSLEQISKNIKIKLKICEHDPFPPPVVLINWQFIFIFSDICSPNVSGRACIS